MDIWQIRHCQCTWRRWPSPRLSTSLAPFLLPAPGALPRCCENRALSYRVVVNDGYDDEPLKRTTTLSAISSRALMGAPSLTASSGTKQHSRASAIQWPCFEASAAQRSQGQEGGQKAEEPGKERAGASEDQYRERAREDTVRGLPQQYVLSAGPPLSPHTVTTTPRTTSTRTQEQQRRAHGIRGDQYENDVADTAMSSRPVTHGVCNSGRSPAPTVSKGY